MPERQTYPSRKHLRYLNTNPGMAEHNPEVPHVQKKPFAKIATFSVGNLSHVSSNGNEIVRPVRSNGFGHGIRSVPLVTQPIIPPFKVRNRGHLGGGTSKETLRRAKRKIRDN